jgi:hypothetical protein
LVRFVGIGTIAFDYSRLIATISGE